MVFTELKLKGAFLIEPERTEDDRGFLARSWCQREFVEHGLNPNVAQCSISFNTKKGTLRGMHYQIAPHQETKLVRCTRGIIYDVVLDLRRDSPTFTQWVGVELTADDHRMIYVPYGCAHGFQVLVDGAEVFYQISSFHEPESARGVRWDDPAFRIVWPIPGPILSDRDRSFPDFDG